MQKRLHDLIEASLELVDQGAREKYHLLAAFAPGPASFDTTCLSQVWEVNEATAADLAGSLFLSGLIERHHDHDGDPARTNRFYVRQIFHQYLISPSTKEEPTFRAAREMAQAKHAACYCRRLDKLAADFRHGGTPARAAVTGLRLDVQQIVKGQRWAKTHAPDDINALELCSQYAVSTGKLRSFTARQDLIDGWAKWGLYGALRLQDHEAIVYHLIEFAEYSESFRLLDLALELRESMASPTRYSQP